MGTKSREVIYGGRVRAAKMNADRARKLAVEAAREADRAEAHAWSLRMEGFGGPAQPSPTIAQCLNGGYGWLEEVPQVRDSGQHSSGRRPPTPQYADLEAGGGAQMPVVPNAAIFTASPYDQADRNSRDRAVSVGSPGR
jgi:hypothetical protein